MIANNFREIAFDVNLKKIVENFQNKCFLRRLASYSFPFSFFAWVHLVWQYTNTVKFQFQHSINKYFFYSFKLLILVLNIAIFYVHYCVCMWIKILKIASIIVNFSIEPDTNTLNCSIVRSQRTHILVNYDVVY